jgi:anti-sigma-K factor RskA
MDALLARFFDGDLDDREAREFLETVEADPELSKELRAYERVLAAAKAMPSPRVPAGFTESVMRSVAAEPSVQPVRHERVRPAFFRMPVFRMQWAGAAVAAAAVVVAFAGGLWTGRGRSAEPAVAPERQAREATSIEAVNPLVSGTTAAASGLRYVRLVYVPADQSVENVAVAGSFNNWDASSTPLRKQDGVWSTILVLPAGSYEYMFVENGTQWVTDPLAAAARDDGFGRANAVLDVEL